MKRTLLCASALCCVLLAGCGSTAEKLRSQPTVHLVASPENAVIPMPSKLEPYVKLRCMALQDAWEKPPGPRSTQECLYVAAEAPYLAVAPDDLRDVSISFLVGLSDMNCSNFLHRAFANKAGLDFTKSFSSDLATGLSAGTAHVNPAVSAALSIGNLLIGKGVESFNATYYYEKTFQALKAVISANRQEIRRQIFARQDRARTTPTVPYSMTEAIADLREYDDACSIMSGLDRLVQVANNEQASEAQKKRSVEVSANPAARQEQLTNTPITGTPSVSVPLGTMTTTTIGTPAAPAPPASGARPPASAPGR